MPLLKCFVLYYINSFINKGFSSIFFLIWQLFIIKIIKNLIVKYNGTSGTSSSAFKSLKWLSCHQTNSKSRDGKFKTGDKVIIHSRRGDIEGVISDFDTNLMTSEETTDVDYDHNGRTMTMIGVPLKALEKTRNISRRKA